MFGSHFRRAGAVVPRRRVDRTIPRAECAKVAPFWRGNSVPAYWRRSGLEEFEEFLELLLAGCDTGGIGGIEAAIEDAALDDNGGVLHSRLLD